MQPAYDAPAQLLISYHFPHTIIETKGLNNFLFSHDISGQSLQDFFGPKTDAIRLHSAIKASLHRSPTSVYTTLYHYDGDEIPVLATCTPLLHPANGALLGCALTIIPSSAPFGPDAAALYEHAAARISSPRPHAVRTVPIFARSG
eukprot:CAMPEP_0172183254 /NCGR_PEP_ID=MMETSP1050-20130122/18878_1 /TAXON_ID=233186 /ORGANISM="Cryptomonas curvata, Strain CCAP979/52" /LENGTH=145 /DNA_ID=CAMNT_0012856841 /DNA_START=61 /DNA_END=495 /DNA_ORIENTATION=+